MLADWARSSVGSDQISNFYLMLGIKRSVEYKSEQLV